jgi:hypothetical protein
MIGRRPTRRKTSCNENGMHTRLVFAPSRSRSARERSRNRKRNDANKRPSVRQKKRKPELQLRGQSWRQPRSVNVSFNVNLKNSKSKVRPTMKKDQLISSPPRTALRLKAKFCPVRLHHKLLLYRRQLTGKQAQKASTLLPIAPR